MKAKLVLLSILILTLLCVPCLMSLAESSENNDSPSSSVTVNSSSSEGHDSENSFEDTDSSSSDEDSEDSEDSDSEGYEDSEDSEDSESRNEKESSSSESYRFTGDPVQSKNPKFSELDLGDCDPDDGKDFELEVDEEDGVFSIAINNSNIEKKMTGKDNFFIDYEDCRLWLPIEIPADCVVDDNLLSNLTVTYGKVSDSVLNKVVSSIKSSQILQTFSLTLTNYDVKGQARKMNSFDGTIKIKYAVNTACINQYNHGKQLALVFYDTDTRSLKSIEYTLDTDSKEMTVYLSNSGDFFIINSAELDLSSEIKLDSKPPFIKVMLYLITFLSLAVAIGFAGFIIYKDKIAKKEKTRKH